MKLDAKLRRLLKQAGYDKPGKVSVETKRERGTKIVDGKHLIDIKPKDYYCPACEKHIGLFRLRRRVYVIFCPRCNETITLKGECT